MLSLEHIFIHSGFFILLPGIFIFSFSPEIVVSVPISVHFICVAVAASELSHTDIKSIPSLNKLFYVIWHPGLCPWVFLVGCFVVFVCLGFLFRWGGGGGGWGGGQVVSFCGNSQKSIQHGSSCFGYPAVATQQEPPEPWPGIHKLCKIILMGGR